MAARCCICGRPVEQPRQARRAARQTVSVAEDDFHYHRERPACREAIRRMKTVLKRKHAERWAE